jgi:hypothetical protein
VTRIGDHGDWTCTEVLGLPGGELSISVLFQHLPSSRSPITGGTGVYRDAGGFIDKVGGEDYTLHIDKLARAS